MVKPKILYGDETWGFGNNEIIERIHLKFCKLLLHLKIQLQIIWSIVNLEDIPLVLILKLE
jgi:hypothetical protein